MNNLDMPLMASSTYTSNPVVLHNFGTFGVQAQTANQWDARENLADVVRRAQAIVADAKENGMSQPLRMVQVFIADPNENIQVDDRLLYKGDPKLTDATDQELFFEVDIKTLLDAHNLKRIKVVDKKVKDRTEYLEPAKIRELKMVVVTIASF